MKTSFDDMKFTFDEEMIHNALEANGWNDLWHPDNWVHSSNTNPDRSGVTKKQAFQELLYRNNLIPRNVDKCWNK